MKRESMDAFKRRQMMAMVGNAGAEGVFVALPEEKVTVRELEKLGTVWVRRTTAKCSGHQVWYVFGKGVGSCESR